MKQITLFISILTFLAVVPSANAQKLKKEKLQNTAYVQPKATNLLDNSKHYQFDILLSNYDEYRKRNINDAFKVQEFNKLKGGGDSDFRIIFEENEMRFSTPKKRTHTKKSKGETTTTTKKYSFKGRVDFEYTMIVKKNGFEIFRTTFEDDQAIKGPKMDTEEMANACYNKQVNEIDLELALEAVTYFEDVFNDRFTNMHKTLPAKLFVLEKPTKEQMTFVSATDKLLQTDISRMNEQGKNKLRAEAIAEYEALINTLENSKQSKKDRKLLAAANYNIGVAHFLMGNYAQSEHFLLQSNGIVDFNLTQEKVMQSAVLCSARTSVSKVDQ